MDVVSTYKFEGQPKCLSPLSLQLGSFSDGSKYILLHATNRVTSELVSPQEITQILNDNLMKTFQIYLAFTYSDILAEYIDQLAQK